MNPSSPWPSPAGQSAQRALGASTVALVVACAGTLAFLPPMVDVTTGSIPRILLMGLAVAVGVILHWVFLGIAARRLGRSTLGWVSLAVLLWPIGGIAALILLGFFDDETKHVPAAPAPAPGA